MRARKLRENDKRQHAFPPQHATFTTRIPPSSFDPLHHARHELHMALDHWWSRGPQHNRRAKRKRVYRWLMEVTGMSREDCHIAKFDRGVCEAVDAITRVE